MGSGWFLAGRRGLVAAVVLVSMLLAAMPGAAQDATPVTGPAQSDAQVEGSDPNRPTPTETPVEPGAPPGTLAVGDEAVPAGTSAARKPGDQSMRLSVQSVETDAGGVTCVQVSEGDDVVAAGEYVVFQCDNADSSLLNAGSYPNYYLRFHSVTTGWRYSSSPTMARPDGDPTSNPEGWSAPSTTGGVVVGSSDNVTRAYIALGPDPATAMPGSGELAIEFLQGRNYQRRAAPYPEPRAATLGAMYREQVPACQPVASASSVAFGVSTRTPDGYPFTRARIVISIDLAADGACSGFPEAWTLRMSATAMTGPGGATIPADAISYAGAAPGAAPPAGVTAVDGVVPLSTQAQAIAVGDASAEAGNWEVVLEAAPPGDAPPGDYGGTLTVDIGTSSG